MSAINQGADNMTTTNSKSTAPNPEATGALEFITLDHVAREAGISPREARMMLRLAAKQTKQYPNLGNEHEPRQPWQWLPGSKALDEARKALTVPDAS
jgi:hypothetical protein